MDKNIYHVNRTMRTLGKQAFTRDMLNEDFINVLTAHQSLEEDTTFHIGIDFFMLGIMYGKRLERAKKRKK